MRFASLAIAFTRLLAQQQTTTTTLGASQEAQLLVSQIRLQKCVADSLVLRGRVLLSINRPKMALLDARNLVSIDQRRGVT